MAKQRSSDALKKSLRDYVTVIFRRIWLFAVPAVLVTALVTAGVLSMPKKYRATATARRLDQVVLNATMHGGNVGDARASLSVIKVEILANTHLAKLLQRAEVAQVMKVNLNEMSEPAQLEVLDKLRKQIDIAAVAQSPGVQIVSISVDDEIPNRAKVLANAMALNYAKYHRDVLEQQFTTATEYQKKQLADSAVELEKVEKEIERYTTENFYQLPGEKTRTLQQRAELGRELPLAELRLTEAQKNLVAHQEKMKGLEKRIRQEVSPTRSPEAVQLQDRISRLESNLTTLLLEYTPQHPDVKQAQMELDAARERLKTLSTETTPRMVEIDNPLYQATVDDEKRLFADVKAQEESVQYLKLELDNLTKQIATFTPDAYRYNDMLRRRDEWSRKYANYRAMLDQSEGSLRAEVAERGTIVEVFDAAREPGTPVFPPPMYMILGLAVAVGLGAGAGAVLLGEVSDSSFRTVEDAASYLEFPVLGTIGTIQPAASRARIWIKWIAFLLLVAVLVAGMVLAYLYQDDLRPLVSSWLNK